MEHLCGLTDWQRVEVSRREGVRPLQSFGETAISAGQNSWFKTFMITKLMSQIQAEVQNLHAILIVLTIRCNQQNNKIREQYNNRM